MNEPILLKKYGNRRLYDCSRSTYVTLADVEEMLQRGDDIRVVDSKTGDDLTRSVLIQIILERDESRDVLPPSFLKQVIRFGNSPLKEHFTRALLNYLNIFLQSQNAMSAQFVENTASYFQPGNFLNPFALFTPPYRPGSSAGEPGGHTNSYPTGGHWSDRPVEPADQGELDAIKNELAKTQAMVREMIQNQAVTENAGSKRKPKKRSVAKKKSATSKKSTKKASTKKKKKGAKE